ncbi:MAG: hypothetical protein GWN20_17860 [Phycisphaerae bacterium]|nr:hypothetical protein [Phycisphaerae bacterium]
MSNVILGVICGVAFGVVDVLLMIPLNLPNKTIAMTGAFCNRFAIGFVIAISVLPVPPWLKGLIISLLLSLPEAIITKAWGPIMGMGAVGGLIIGWAVGKWGV